MSALLRSVGVCRDWCGTTVVGSCSRVHRTCYGTIPGPCWCSDDCHRAGRSLGRKSPSAPDAPGSAGESALTGRITIPVAGIEFDVGGNTMWIQAAGGTVLRIKTLGGKFLASECATSPVSHADIMTTGDVHVCVAKADAAEPEAATDDDGAALCCGEIDCQCPAARSPQPTNETETQ